MFYTISRHNMVHTHLNFCNNNNISDNDRRVCEISYKQKSVNVWFLLIQLCNLFAYFYFYFFLIIFFYEVLDIIQFLHSAWILHTGWPEIFIQHQIKYQTLTAILNNSSIVINSTTLTWILYWQHCLYFNIHI